MRRLLTAFVLLLAGGTANAVTISDDITGADMAGMNVTALFADGSQETATWIVTSTDPTVPDGEGFAGGAFGTGWSLTQQGFSLGNVVGGAVLGEWTLNNDAGQSMTSLVIDAMAGDIVFDLGLPTTTAEFTPGSGSGRDFTPDPTSGPLPDATYGALFSAPDLWGELTLTWNANNLFASGSELRFLADTDQVPLPGTAMLLVIGVLGLAARHRAASSMTIVER